MMSDKKSSVILLNRLQQTLLEIGNTNEEIADELGCDHSTINKWYNGKLTPSLDKIVSICKKANVSIDYLCGFRNEPTNNAKISDICDYTKLSELTVKHIQSIQAMFDNELLNYLFECGAITDIVEVIYNALKYADTYNPSQFRGEVITQIDNTVVDYFDLLMGNNKVQKELDLSEFNATRILQNAIEELYLNCGATDKSIQINKIIKETKTAGGLDD